MNHCKVEINKIKKILVTIEESKLKIGKERDKLYGVCYELESLLGSIESGIEGLDSGKRGIEDAIDSLSEYM